MAERRAYRLDNKLTAMMVDDMMFDPILAGRVIFDIDLPPHEELRVMWMWGTYYTNDDSGFSTGKSWTLAYVAALRSILMAGRISGMLSMTFSQGKLIFANFDRWYYTSKIFRSCIKHTGNRPRLVHGTDAWVAHFRGGSEIRVLPPNWLGDAERIRSERWHDAYLDEWTTYGNFKALNTTIIGRVTAANHFPNCPVRKNHIHQSSTPAFEHDPAYKIVKMVDRHIKLGNTNYGRFTCNYRCVPDTPQWRWLINRNVIFHMQTVNPKGIVTAEIDGRWAKDSASFYSSNIIQRVRLGSIPLYTERDKRARNEIFIAGFDVAIGGGDNSAGSGDDFSLSVFKMVVGEWLPVHVFTVRYNKISDVMMAGIVHKFHRRFGFSLVVFDPGGGGLFVREKLRNTKQLIDGEMVQCTPIITVLDNSGTEGESILVPFSRGDFYIKQMWGKLPSDSVLVNRAHRDFKTAIEQRRVILSGKWDGWEGSESVWDCDAKRDHLNKRQFDDNNQRYMAEMDLAISQLMIVDVLRDKNGIPLLDSYNQYKFKSKDKKDSAYGLLYAHVGVIIYKWMHETGIADENDDDNNDTGFSIMEIV